MQWFKKKLLSASDIAKAYNDKKKHLVAMEVKGCCPGVPDSLIVMNQGVVIRQVLEELGFNTKEINAAFKL